MGMFDTIYSELTCPFCGMEYKYNPPSYAEAKEVLDEQRQREERIVSENGTWFNIFYGHMSQDEIISHLAAINTEEAIQSYLSKKLWGLAEIQTKAFASLMDEFYIGDVVPYCHYGHFFIKETFRCEGCCMEPPIKSVLVWLEMEDHKILSVRTNNPETGKAERHNWKTNETEYK